MRRNFRLLELEENTIVKYDLPVIMVKLAELQPSSDSKGYFFPIYEGEMFVFLDSPENNAYFLENPEEIKSLDMNQFFEGSMLIAGTSVKTFDHWEYVDAIRKRKRDMGL